MTKSLSKYTIPLFGLFAATALYYYRHNLADYIIQKLNISSTLITDLILWLIALIIGLILVVSLRSSIRALLPLSYMMAIYFSFRYLPNYIWIPLMTVALMITWYFLSYKPYKEAVQEGETT